MKIQGWQRQSTPKRMNTTSFAQFAALSLVNWVFKWAAWFQELNSQMLYPGAERESGIRRRSDVNVRRFHVLEV